jgi:hypothetical protein
MGSGDIQKRMYEPLFTDLMDWFENCPFVVENDTLRRKWSFREWKQKKTQN